MGDIKLQASHYESTNFVDITDASVSVSAASGNELISVDGSVLTFRYLKFIYDRTSGGTSGTMDVTVNYLWRSRN